MQMTLISVGKFETVVLPEPINVKNSFLKNKRICEEIASVYAWSLECNNYFNESQSGFDEYFSSTLFPFMKKCCFFEKTQFENYSYNLLNLEDAYKIFERC